MDVLSRFFREENNKHILLNLYRKCYLRKQKMLFAALIHQNIFSTFYLNALGAHSKS